MQLSCAGFEAVTCAGIALLAVIYVQLPSPPAPKAVKVA